MAAKQASYLSRAGGIAAWIFYAILAVAGIAFPAMTYFRDSGASLDIVSTRIAGGEVEILLQNTGGVSAVIDRVEFVIREHSTLPYMASGRIPVSASYQLEFPNQAGPLGGQVIAADLSHEVDAGRGDRLRVSVGVPALQGTPPFAQEYVVTLILTYDPGRQQVRSEPITLRLFPTTRSERRVFQRPSVAPPPGEKAR